MPSKMITDRQKSAESVIAVADAQKGTLVKGVEALMKPYLKKGEAFPDLEMFVELCARVLEASKDRMVEADAAHDAELGDDAAIRAARDAAAAQLYSRLVELREITTGVYGSEVTAQLFRGPTPEDPV